VPEYVPLRLASLLTNVVGLVHAGHNGVLLASFMLVLTVAALLLGCRRCVAFVSCYVLCACNRNIYCIKNPIKKLGDYWLILPFPLFILLAKFQMCLAFFKLAFLTFWRYSVYILA
jgi:hypothetical protein